MKTYLVGFGVFLIFILKTESASVKVSNSPTSQNAEIAIESPPTRFILITTTVPNDDLAKKFAK